MMGGFPLRSSRIQDIVIPPLPVRQWYTTPPLREP